MIWRMVNYQSSLAASTLIILFVEMLKIFQKKKSFKEQNFVTENRKHFGIFRSILFFDMKSSKLIEAAIVFQYFQTWNGLIFSEYGNLALLQFHPGKIKVAKRCLGCICSKLEQSIIC